MMRRLFKREKSSIFSDVGFATVVVLGLVAVLAVVGAGVPFILSYLERGEQMQELEEQKTTQELLSAQRIQGLNRRYESNIRKLRSRFAIERQSFEGENQKLKQQLEALQQKQEEAASNNEAAQEQTQDIMAQNAKLKENFELALALSQKHMISLPYGAGKGLNFENAQLKQKVIVHVKDLEKKGLKQFRIYSYSSNVDDAFARSEALKQAIETREFLVSQGVHENFIAMRVLGNKPGFNTAGKSVSRVDIRGMP